MKMKRLWTLVFVAFALPAFAPSIVKNVVAAEAAPVLEAGAMMDAVISKKDEPKPVVATKEKNDAPAAVKEKKPKAKKSASKKPYKKSKKAKQK